MTFAERIPHTLAAWMTAAFVYMGCGAINGDTWVIPETPVDKVIPFNAAGVWFYLSFYIIIPYTFFTVEREAFKRLWVSFTAVSLLSGLIFLIWPSTIQYPRYGNGTISADVLAFVSANDTDRNCFPSLHASLIALCAFALFSGARWVRRFFVVVVTLAVYYSIIQVRRHVFIDLAGGFVLAGVVWRVIVRRKG